MPNVSCEFSAPLIVIGQRCHQFPILWTVNAKACNPGDSIVNLLSTKMFFYCQQTNSSMWQPHAAFDLLWALFDIDAQRQIPYISQEQKGDSLISPRVCHERE